MKKELRQTIMTARGQLTPEEVFEKSRVIHTHLLNSNLLQDRSTIMLYMDFRNEVATVSLIEHLWSLHKKIIIPKVNKETHFLDLYEIESFDDLELSPFGILEPSSKRSPNCQVEDLDLILAPGVCFDLNGFRMGYGGGFYDKLLPRKKKSCPVIALAFELQIVPKVPTEPHDQKLNGLITEKGCYFFE